MSWLWAVPVIIALIGLGTAMVLARGMATAVRALRAEVELTEALRPPIADLQAELRRIRRPEAPGARR